MFPFDPPRVPGIHLMYLGWMKDCVDCILT